MGTPRLHNQDTKLKEGDRVFCDSLLEEGIVMRSELWGDVKVHVYIPDQDFVYALPIDSLMVI
jgi:hypothetical protein